MENVVVEGPLLDIRDLAVSFATAGGEVRAVDGVSLQLRRGEVLAIVGESGSGKSVCAMTLMGLTRGPNTTITGNASLEGQELIGISEMQLRRIRGARMAMVFQDPQSSLNPVYRVGDQIAEQIRAHEPGTSSAQAAERAATLMERVGIPRARERVRAYVEIGRQRLGERWRHADEHSKNGENSDHENPGSVVRNESLVLRSGRSRSRFPVRRTNPRSGEFTCGRRRPPVARTPRRRHPSPRFGVPVWR